MSEPASSKAGVRLVDEARGELEAKVKARESAIVAERAIFAERLAQAEKERDEAREQIYANERAHEHAIGAADDYSERLEERLERVREARDRLSDGTHDGATAAYEILTRALETTSEGEE
jgi:chromosome segregation ATPase